MDYYKPACGDVAVDTWQNRPLVNESTERMLFNNMNSGINFDKYENIPVEASGAEVPPPIENFSDAVLHEWVQENIQRSGYDKPTPVQKNSLPTLLARRDLMSCAQTGSGKTAAFLVPIINNLLTGDPSMIKDPVFTSSGRKVIFPAALIIAPTRELAMQISKEADKFAYRTNILVAMLYGGRENYREQINRLKLGCHILIATPGRLIDIIEQGYLGLQAIQYLVLDEADRMLDMGFEPQIRKVISMNMPDKKERTTAMFSATFPKEIQVLAQDFLTENYVFLAVGRVGSTSENIQQTIEWVEDHDKKRALCHILEITEAQSLLLIFVETKRGANELAWFLQRQNVRAVAIHGDLKQYERERNLDLFRKGQNNVLVATAVAARGLDIPNVRHVVNFDLPNDIDEYVHRIGRTGRCGNIGQATSFFNDKNRPMGRDLLTLLSEANQEVPDFIRRVASEPGSGRGNGRGGRFGGTDHRRGIMRNMHVGNNYHTPNHIPTMRPPGQNMSFFPNGTFAGGRQPYQVGPIPPFGGFGHQQQNGFGGSNTAPARAYHNGAPQQNGYTPFNGSQHQQQQYQNGGAAGMNGGGYGQTQSFRGFQSAQSNGFTPANGQQAAGAQAGFQPAAQGGYSAGFAGPMSFAGGQQAGQGPPSWQNTATHAQAGGFNGMHQQQQQPPMAFGVWGQ